MAASVVDSAANIFLNAIISVVCSWVISAYYFRKESRAEKISDQIRNGLQRALLPIIHPQFFDSQSSHTLTPLQPKPKNTDIPHIDYAILSFRPNSNNTRVELMIKILDTGYDLENPEGISIKDHTGGYVGVVSIGLGHCKCTINIGDNPIPGVYEITVEMADSGLHRRATPNRNVQTLPFIIE